ncbi:hypothetical protein ACFL50_06350 [Candidatus Latescibacterota bacterium]
MINGKRIIAYMVVFIFVLSILFIFANNSIFPEQIIHESEEISINDRYTIMEESFEILSITEMSTLIGGCSSTGGTCKTYYHTCPDGCTHVNAKTCQGSFGTCYQPGFSIVCRCQGYIYVKGCL